MNPISSPAVAVPTTASTWGHSATVTASRASRLPAPDIPRTSHMVGLNTGPIYEECPSTPFRDNGR
jgi:hypothetical protein